MSQQESNAIDVGKDPPAVWQVIDFKSPAFKEDANLFCQARSLEIKNTKELSASAVGGGREKRSILISQKFLGRQAVKDALWRESKGGGPCQIQGMHAVCCWMIYFQCFCSKCFALKRLSGFCINCCHCSQGTELQGFSLSQAC